MRLYHSGGFQEFTPDEFLDYLLLDGLVVEHGEIEALRILNRKTWSNKGDALEGKIFAPDGFSSIGLNIGGNPRGHETYIPFLKAMGCEKGTFLYDIDSLVGQKITYVLCEDHVRGYLIPEEFSEAMKRDE